MTKLEGLKLPDSFQGSIDGIPATASEINDQSDPEVETFWISLKYYNNKECGAKHLTSSASKFALFIKRVGQSACEDDLKKCYKYSDGMGHRGAKYKPVDWDGEYKKIYKSLPKDVQLFEIKIGKDQRVFFYTVDRYFFIIAITEKHYETKKNR